MASNPHSDFTTHIRTLPTLSNLQLSPQTPSPLQTLSPQSRRKLDTKRMVTRNDGHRNDHLMLILMSHCGPGLLCQKERQNKMPGN